MSDDELLHFDDAEGSVLLESSSIVSDKRADRASLSENLKSAFNEWWGHTQRTIHKSIDSASAIIATEVEPEAIIQKAEVRVETIKEASVYTAQAPKNEHLTILEKPRLDKTQIEPIKLKPAIPKNKSTNVRDAGAWSHIIGAEDVSEAKPKDTKIVVGTSDNKDTLNATRKPSKIVSQPIVQKAPQAQNQNTKVTQKIFPSHFNTSSPSAVHTEQHIPTKQSIPLKREPVSSAIPVTEQMKSPLHSAPQVIPPQPQITYTQMTPPPVVTNNSVTQNVVFIYLIRGVSIIGIIALGIGSGLMTQKYFSPSTKEEVVAVTKTTTLPSVPQNPIPKTMSTIPLSDDRSMFLADLSEKIEFSTEHVSQFIPTIEDREATTQEFFDFLNTTLSSQAIRSLDSTMTIGGVFTSKNEPYILMRTSSFDVLFSEMLLWESHIQEDLHPLFGQSLSQKNFSDTIINNKSARILTDDAGKIILIYSFINQSTIVITTSREALSKVSTKF